MMADRARLSKLSTYVTSDDGKLAFVGSSDFPPALIESCNKYDPRAILFGTSKVPTAELSEPEQRRLGMILDQRIQGKKFLLCSGGDDKLVPYRCSKPFVDWFKHATSTWYKHGNVGVEDNVYPGIGHLFSADMVTDSIRFILDVVSSAGEQQQKSSVKLDDADQRASKI
jgi:hypothetical protein